MLVNWILTHKSRFGTSLRHGAVRKAAAKLANKKKLLSVAWYYHFIKQHKCLQPNPNTGDEARAAPSTNPSTTSSGPQIIDLTLEPDTPKEADTGLEPTSEPSTSNEPETRLEPRRLPFLEVVLNTEAEEIKWREVKW